MNFDVLKELATPVEGTEGAVQLPYMRDGGAVEVATAFAKHNWQTSIEYDSFKKDADFDFDAEKDKLAEGLSETSARIFKNGGYTNREDAMRNLRNFQKADYLTRSAAEGGWKPMAGMVLGHMADWTLLTGAGASVTALKTLNNSRKLASAMDKLAKAGASAKQVAIADAAVKGTVGSVAFDAGMMGPQMAQGRADWEEAEDAIFTGLVFTGLVGGPMALRNIKAATELREAGLAALDSGANPIREITKAHGEVDAVRKAADEYLKDTAYQKLDSVAMKAELPSRFSQTTNTELESVNEMGRKLFQDPTYLRTDTKENIQSITADVEADKWTYSVEGLLGEKLAAGREAFLASPEGKAWAQKNGISWWDRTLSKPVNDKMAYDIHRHLSAGGRIEDLPVGLREMAQAMDEATETTFNQMKRFGVEGTQELEHVAGHMRRLHDDQAYRDVIHSFGDVKVGEEALTKAMTESIVKGAVKEGAEITPALARRLALIVQHRVLALGSDKMALEGILSSPNTFYKEAKEFLKDDKQALKLTQEAFGNPKWAPGDRAKRMGSESDKDTMLRRRIPMDLSVAIGHGKVNKWGDELRMSDLMITDAFELTHRYVRRGMGNAALAKSGLKSLEDIDNFIAKAQQEAKFAKDGQKAADAITRLQEGIRRIQGVGAVEEITGAQAKAATIMAMLGRHATGVGLGGAAIAGLSELARVINRTGFRTIINMVPALRETSDKKLLDAFKEYGLYYGNSRLMGSFSHLEDFGSNTLSTAGALASQSAQAALKFSGLSLMDQMTRQAALIGWARQIERQVVQGKRGAKGFRLSEMGWKPEVSEKISSYIKQHGFDMDNWRTADGRIDYGTIEEFTSGGHKVISENVTRMFSGESNAVVDGPIGSMFLQFRKIVYATYNKSLIRGLSQVDAITASNLVAGLAGAIAVNEMRTAVKSAGMSEKERKEYMKKWNLRYAMTHDDGDLAQAFVGTMSYTPAGGPFAEATALLSSMLFGVDLRGRHQSGPQTIFQSPSIQLLENMTRTAGGLVTAPFKDDPDYDDMQRRAKAIIPLQNWYAVPLIANSLSED